MNQAPKNAHKISKDRGSPMSNFGTSTSSKLPVEKDSSDHLLPDDNLIFTIPFPFRHAAKYFAKKLKEPFPPQSHFRTEKIYVKVISPISAPPLGQKRRALVRNTQRESPGTNQKKVQTLSPYI